MPKRLISPVLTDAFVPSAPTKTSNYPLDWMNVFSAEFSKLHVICCEEVLPKDHWKGHARSLVRFEPLIKPLLSEVNVFTHFFFVPNRILWPNWERFISGVTKNNGGYNPVTDPEPVKPYFVIDQNWPSAYDDQLAIGSLADFMGVNITGPEARGSRTPAFNQYSQKVDLMPFLAFQCIWDHWYRNKNFNLEYVKSFDDIQSLCHDGQYTHGDVDDLTYLSYMLNNRGRDWEPDYFTSALPWPQRHESILIPFEPYNDIVKIRSDQKKNSLLRYSANDGLASDIGFVGSNSNAHLVSRGLVKEQLYDSSNQPITDADGHETESAIAISSANSGLYLDPNDTLGVPNLGNASTIEDLRIARILQNFNEIEGYADNDYQGQIEALFGVRIPDYRIDKPELIGGGRQPVNVDAVMQTSSTDAVTPQGNMVGHAYSAPTDAYFEYTAYEHGWIIGIMTIMPRTLYSQGLHKKFQRFDRFDYAWPQFATLGAQEVKTSELYIHEYGDRTFGYVPRYFEYKTHQSEVHGTVKTTDDYWTLARTFAQTPILSMAFLSVQGSDLTDIFANQVGPNMFVRTNFHCNVDRVLPFKATPLI